MLLGLAAMVAMAAPAFEFNLQSGTGLTVAMGGVPIVRGTWFQYFEPDWSRGYYSSNWNPQTIERVSPDEIRMRFASDQLSGSQTYRREGNRLIGELRFEWKGERPVRVEMTAGMLWQPAFRAGQLVADGAPPVSLRRPAVTSPDIDPRRLAPDAQLFELDGPLGKVELKSDQPLTIFDARGYRQDWAERSPLLWLGGLGLEVTKEKPLNVRLEWTFTPKPRPEPPVKTVVPSVEPVKDAENPPIERAPLVPQPRRFDLNYDRPLEITGRYVFPAGRFRNFDAFTKALARRFILPTPTNKTPTVQADGGEKEFKIAPGYHELTITPKGFSILGETEYGVRLAGERLARLAFVKNGKLFLPTGRVFDGPRAPWRGVHLFVGPQAAEFQRRLWERVLFPMGFNKVVLQCEQTAWQSLPGIGTARTMPREKLVSLFAMYRNLGVEPIPLIQSFGHMEWFFANGQNREAAFNPEVLYSVDPRKPETRSKLNALWDEVITTLKPENIHFGLDEVDMRGWPEDPELVSTLWELHLPFLGQIAKRHNVKMMLWGDKALAPGEAPDATHGDTKAHAIRRRAAIPKGATITSWHYKADARPETFYPVLQLWKREGFGVIGSAWYRPENIRGLNLAANLEKAGTLQTTWAGYESNEAAMVAAMPQFAAMILAGDYAWSDRQEMPDKLGYDPMTILRDRYFEEPRPLTARAGSLLRWSPSDGRRGGVRVADRDPLRMFCALDPDAQDAPMTLNIEARVRAKTLVLLADTTVVGDQGETVATLRVDYADGTNRVIPLRYGLEVVASDDVRAPWLASRDGACVIRVSLDPKKVTRGFRFDATNVSTGLRVHAITALP